MKKVQDLLNFQGKTAIITGAAVAFGQASAYRPAAAYANLCLSDTGR
jgi:NAD(P)-dependent dehydrogenase (short-subunit alcohol dehydrogenase family)